MMMGYFILEVTCYNLPHNLSLPIFFWVPSLLFYYPNRKTHTHKNNSKKNPKPNTEVILYRHCSNLGGCFFMKFQISQNCDLSTIHKAEKWTERTFKELWKENQSPCLFFFLFNAIKESLKHQQRHKKFSSHNLGITLCFFRVHRFL